MHFASRRGDNDVSMAIILPDFKVLNGLVDKMIAWSLEAAIPPLLHSAKKTPYPRQIERKQSEQR